MGAASLNQIFSRLNGITPYHPLSAETYADWSLEAGDIVQLSRDGVAYSAPVHSSTLRWNGSQKISLLSEGNRERDPISAVSQAKYNAGRGGSGGRRSNQQLNWEMTSEDGKLKASIKASAEELTSQYEEADSGLSSRIEQNAKSASMSVGRVTYDSTKKETVTELPDISGADATKFYYVSGTQKYYIVRNGKWQQVDVDTTTGGAYYIKAGDIAIAINDSGETTAKIDADKVYLGRIGDTNFSDLQAFAGDAATKGGVFADYLYTRGLTTEQLNAKFGFIADLTLEGLTIDKSGDPSDLGNLSVGGTVDANRLILYDDSYGIYFNGSSATAGSYIPRSLTINGTEQAKFLGTADVSFSRATSLTPAWSGGATAGAEAYLTLTGSPDDSLEYEIQFGHDTGDLNLYIEHDVGEEYYNNGQLVEGFLAVPTKIQQKNAPLTPGGQPTFTTRYTANGVIDATVAWDQGEASGKATGWAAAWGKVAVPNTEHTSSNVMTVSVPVQTYGEDYDHDFTVSADATYAYITDDEDTILARVTHNQYSLGQSSVKVIYDNNYDTGGQDPAKVIKRDTSGNGSNYIELGLDIGTAPSESNRSRTVGVKVDGTRKTELSATLTDYGDGYTDGQNSVDTTEIYNYAARYGSWLDNFGASTAAQSASLANDTRDEDGAKIAYQGEVKSGWMYGLYYIKRNGSKYYKAYWKVPASQANKNVTCSGDMVVTPDSGYKYMEQVTITYDGGGGGSHSPHIDSGNTDIWTTDHALTGWIEANTLKQKYETAKADGDLVAFKVKCGDAVQVYYMNP